MLEKPHFQLGERYGGLEIYSEMERWNITQNSAFFSGSLSGNKSGEMRHLYVQQMLNEFIRYLIDVALDLLNEEEEEKMKNAAVDNEKWANEEDGIY